MARLIDLRRIREEKINRGRSWIYSEIKAGRFPKPLPLGSSRNLWDEGEVDKWLSDFIAKAKKSAEDGEIAAGGRTQKARMERVSRRGVQRAV